MTLNYLRMQIGTVDVYNVHMYMICAQLLVDNFSFYVKILSFLSSRIVFLCHAESAKFFFSCEKGRIQIVDDKR